MLQEETDLEELLVVHSVPQEEIGDDYITWTDVLNLTEMGEGFTRNRHHDIYSQIIHVFKGIRWNVLYRLNDTKGETLFYLGFPRCDYALQLSGIRFQYVLLGKNNEVLNAGNVSQLNLEQDVGKEAAERFDKHFHGSTFDFPTLLHFSYRLDDDSPKFIKVRVTVEEVFAPNFVPRGKLHNHSKVLTDMVGLENLGATCYLNALLQMLYHVNEFRQSVYRMPCTQQGATSTPLALQGVFRELQTSSKAVSTLILLKAFGWTSQDAFMQQDVQEMMRVLLDKLEENMKGTIVDGEVNRLFSGKVSSFIRCLHVDYESRRLEDFYDIQLDVKGCKNVYESFRKYTEKEILSGDNQYDAEKLGKQDAEKGIIFQSFPPVLTIHLKRFDFDYERMGFTKIHDFYEFPTRMCLDDFLAPDSPQRLAGETQTFVLHSVLVHHGDVGGGHYYAYIRPTTKHFSYSSLPLSEEAANVADDKAWFKFNDESVSSVTEREAIQNCFGQRPSRFINDLNSDSTSSAYMLVYILESQASRIMAPVSTADIPDGLNRRLNFTRIQRLLNEIRVKFTNAHHVRDCNYVLEKDVKNFSSYSKYLDFVDFDAIVKTQFVQMPTIFTSTLSMVISIAEKLKVPAYCIRLWRINFDEKTKALRASRPVSINENAMWSIKDPIWNYYVEILDPSINDDLNLVVYNRRLEQFQSSYQNLLEKARRLRDELIGEIAKNIYEVLENVTVDAADETAMRTCKDTLLQMIPILDMEAMLRGFQLGSNSKFLETLFKDRDIFRKIDTSEFHSRLNEISKQLLNLLSSMAVELGRNAYDKDYGRNSSENVHEEKLLFIRIFDPTGDIRRNRVNSCPSPFKKEKNNGDNYDDDDGGFMIDGDEDDEQYSSSDNGDMEVESTHSSSDLPLASAVKCPLHYVQTIRVSPETKYSTFLLEIQDIIQQKYPHLKSISRWRPFFGMSASDSEDEDEDLVDIEEEELIKSLRIWRLVSPFHLEDLRGIESDTLLASFHSGDILIIDPEGSYSNAHLSSASASAPMNQGQITTTTLSSNTLTNSALLMSPSRGRSNSVASIGRANVGNQFMKNAKEWFSFLTYKVQIHFLAVDEPEKRAFLNRFKAFQKFKSQQKKSSRAYSKKIRQLNIDGTSNDRIVMIGGQGNNNQNNDEDISSEAQSDSDDSEVQLGQFNFEFHLNQDFSAVFDTVATRLGLSDGYGAHIVLYAATNNLNKILASSLCFRNSEISIQKGFDNVCKGWSRDSDEKHVYYRLLPLEMPYLDRQDFFRHAEQFRFSNIFISDRRVIYWRRLFIQKYISHLLNTLEPESLDFYTLLFTPNLESFVKRVNNKTISSELLGGIEEDCLHCVNWSTGTETLNNVPFPFLSELDVFYPLPVTHHIGEQMESLRHVIGLPLALNERGGCGLLAPPVDPSPFGVGVGVASLPPSSVVTEAGSGHNNVVAEAQLSSLKSLTSANTTSESVSPWMQASNQLMSWILENYHSKDTAVIEKIAQFNRCRQILQTEFLIDKPTEINPFPLSILLLDDYKVHKVFSYHTHGGMAPLSFADLAVKLYASQLAVQHISTVDVAYMMNLYPLVDLPSGSDDAEQSTNMNNDDEDVIVITEEDGNSHPVSPSPSPFPSFVSFRLRSMGLSVSRVTMISGVNRYESIVVEKGVFIPFLTYVTENDTYETLCARLDIFFSTVDWTKARLILLHDSSPVVIPKNKMIHSLPSSTPVSARSDPVGIVSVGDHSMSRAPTPVSNMSVAVGAQESTTATSNNTTTVPATPAAAEPRPLWEFFVAMYERVQPQYPSRTSGVSSGKGGIDGSIGPQLPPDNNNRNNNNNSQKPLFLELGVQIIGNASSKRSRGIKIT